MKPQIASMTGFARTQGECDATAWIWELRSVNGRGLDIKLRLPAGLDTLEPALREAATKTFKRGNISGTLTLKREAAATLSIDPDALARIKDIAIALADDIPGALPPRAELLLALPGVMRTTAQQDDTEDQKTALQTAISTGFTQAVTQLAASRAAEGARLTEIVTLHLTEIASLHATATTQAAGQPALLKTRLTAQLAELLDPARNVPDEKIAQEIALLATKSDVREELDRLTAHIAAAAALLTEAANIGRKLDFLVQEFNREVNTLCSKSVSIPLTATGLALKAVVEQLREQVQNIE